MSKLRSMIQQLGHAMEEENNAAFDLWTWLPSYKVAQQFHGDYASAHVPSIADVLREAASVIAEAQGHPMSEAERQAWSECPCGKDHSVV